MASDRVNLDPFAAPDDIVIEVLEHFECELASMQLLMSCCSSMCSDANALLPANS